MRDRAGLLDGDTERLLGELLTLRLTGDRCDFAAVGEAAPCGRWGNDSVGFRAVDGEPGFGNKPGVVDEADLDMNADRDVEARADGRVDEGFSLDARPANDLDLRPVSGETSSTDIGARAGRSLEVVLLARAVWGDDEWLTAFLRVG